MDPMNPESTKEIKAGRRLPAPVLLTLGAVALLAVIGWTRAPWSLRDAVETAINNPTIALLNSALAIILSCLLLATVAIQFRIADTPENRVVDTPEETLSPVQRFLTSKVTFALLVVTVIYLWRWPFLAYYQLNPDESQDVAAIITLLRDPRFWLSTDTGTHGPVVSWILAIPTWLFGMRPDFGSARLVGVGLFIASVLLLWRILTRFSTERVARLLILPAVFCIAWICYEDYIAYNGEHAVTFLVTLAAYLGIRAKETQGVSSLWWNAATGVAVGLMLFTKIQGLPIIFTVACLILVAQWKPFANLNTRESITRTLTLAGGALIPLVCVLIYALSIGILADVLDSYRCTLIYAGAGDDALLARKGQTWLNIISWPTWHWEKEIFNPWLMLSVCIAIITLIVLKRRKGENLVGPEVYSAIAVLVASYFAVCKPERNFLHYLVLLFLPGLFFHAVLWARIFQIAESHEHRRLRQILPAIFVVLTLAIPTFCEVKSRLAVSKNITEPILRYPYRVVDTFPLKERLAMEELHLYLKQQILRYARKGDALVAWGWAPRYNVLTGLSQGTRDAVIGRVITPSGKYDPRYLDMFVSDMDRTQPVFFVDAVGANSYFYSDRSRFGPEVFPKLAQRLRENYQIVCVAVDIRIYVRKDRVAEVGIQPVTPVSGNPP